MKEFLKYLGLSLLCMVFIVYVFPEYKIEIFFGWVIPAFSGLLSMANILQAQKKNSIYVTKAIAKGFIFKMFYYGIIILLIIKHYAFQPIPFVCSLVGFFMVLHVTEAIIIKRISEKYIKT